MGSFRILYDKIQTLSNMYQQQSGRKCGVGSQRTCGHFFRLIARILTIFTKKRILTRRDKRESYLIVLQQNNV